MNTTTLDILYHDDHLVAVHKPEGLLVHKSNIDKHENTFLLQTLRDQIGQYLYPIHRLDKPTSGVIIFGLNRDIAAQIQQQMENNTAKKDYLLICRGFTSESGRIDHPLKPIDDFKKIGKRFKTRRTTQDAITDYRRLQTIELNVHIDKYPTSRYSLVLASLLTGRKHQIRRHFKHISHPIIGCPKYGKSLHNRYFAEELGVSRLLLHSYRMTLEHPTTNKPIVITSNPVGQFKMLMDKFGWD